METVNPPKSWLPHPRFLGTMFALGIAAWPVCGNEPTARQVAADETAVIATAHYASAPVASAPARPAAPATASPFSPQLFENDFSYKQHPDHTYIPGEELKDMPLGTLTGRPLFGETTLSTGGELRFRYLDETNRLRPNGPGHSSYDQWRWRHYVDVRHADMVRGYVELIDSSTNHADLPLVVIDKNRWDLQNAFVDLSAPWYVDHPVTVRIGRQEMVYGAQRLISSLDWANTRRNFEGIKLFTRQETWSLDGWVMNPVNSTTTGNEPLAVSDNSFDQRNEDYLFAGTYGTYRGLKDHTFDAFFLYTNLNIPVAGLPYGDRYTLGTRWLGNLLTTRGGVSWQAEIEGGYQFGNDRSALYDAASPRASVQAGYVTAGIGHSWTQHPWKPSVWWYWDWASGDQSPTDGENNTFFQLFGLVHAYMGLMDNLARQNISDVNVKCTVQPGEKLWVQLQHHWYQLATGNDVLYNVAGNPVGSPGNGTNVGNEFDIVATYNVNHNWSLEIGYFWFWYGSYIGAVAPRPTAESIYVMSTLRY